MDDFSAGQTTPTDVDDSVSETTQHTVTQARTNRPLWPMMLVLILAVVLISVQVSRRRDASMDVLPNEMESTDITPVAEGEQTTAEIMPVEVPAPAVVELAATESVEAPTAVSQPLAVVGETNAAGSRIMEEGTASALGAAIEESVEVSQEVPAMATEIVPSATYRLWVVDSDVGLAQIIGAVERLGGTVVQEALNTYAVNIQIAPAQRSLLDEELGRIGLLVQFDAADESPSTDLFRFDLAIYEDELLSDSGDAPAE